MQKNQNQNSLIGSPRSSYAPEGLAPFKGLLAEQVYSDSQSTKTAATGGEESGVDLFDYQVPEELIALQPQRPSRVLWSSGRSATPPCEISLENLLLEKFQPGDLLVINETAVLQRRIFAEDHEILFLKQLSPFEWSVLAPIKTRKIGEVLNLPGGLTARILEKGRPQKLQVSEELQESYFQQYGALPLPPYIQKARGQRHNQPEDSSWYQTDWARVPGSLAAPTASLHFSVQDLRTLQSRGVQIEKITLHVGEGTFLPIEGSLETHRMHQEEVYISQTTAQNLLKARAEGRRIWALGTTVTRTLESFALGLIPERADGFWGFTDLFIRPGHEWRLVGGLLTNFHQPQSTLLALVQSWAGKPRLQQAYHFAIEKRFRFFSYGDLSVWEAPQ